MIKNKKIISVANSKMRGTVDRTHKKKKRVRETEGGCEESESTKKNKTTLRLRKEDQRVRQSSAGVQCQPAALT